MGIFGPDISGPHQKFKPGATIFFPPRFRTPGMPRLPPQVGEVVEMITGDNGTEWKRASVLRLEASRIKVMLEGEEAVQETLILRKENEKWRRCDAPLAHGLPQPGDEVLVEVDIEGRKRWYKGNVVPNTEPGDDEEFQVLVDGDHGMVETYSCRQEGDEWLRPDYCSHCSALFDTLKVPTVKTRFENAVLRPVPPETPQGFIASLQKGMAVEVQRTDGWRMGHVGEIADAQGFVMVEYESDARATQTVLCDPRLRLRPAWVWRSQRWERLEQIEALADAEEAGEPAEEPSAMRSRCKQQAAGSEDTEGEEEEMVQDEEGLVDGRTAASGSESAVVSRLEQDDAREAVEELAGRGGRPKRAKQWTRYDHLPQEGTDSEGRVWRLIPDPKAKGAAYNGFDGTGYVGVYEKGWFKNDYGGIKRTHPFLIKEGNQDRRFKTLIGAAVAYARVQAGLPASLEEQIHEPGPVSESSDAGEEAQEEGVEGVEGVEGDEDNDWCVGSQLEALDAFDMWCKASVLAIRGEGPSRMLEVHYVGWSKRLDVWLAVSGGRLRKEEKAEALKEPSTKRRKGKQTAAASEDEEVVSGGKHHQKLWDGAAAAGWTVQARSGMGHYYYISPTGRKFKSRRSAMEAEAEAEAEVEVEVEGMDVSESGGEELEIAAEPSLNLDGARSPDALSNDSGDYEASDGDQPGPSSAARPSQDLLAADELCFEVCHVDMVGKGGIAQNKLQKLQQLLQGRFCKKNAAFNGVKD